MQQNALDEVLDEHRPVSVTPETLAGWSPPLPMDELERRRVIDAQVRRIDSAAAELPTEFEDPAAYLLYRDVLVRLDRICAALDLRLPERLWFGTLASPKLNSRVLPVDEETDEYLIVISRRFIPFCHQFGGFLAKIVAPELELRPDEGGAFSRPPIPSPNEIERLYLVVEDLMAQVHTRYDEAGDLSNVVHDRRPRRQRITVAGTAAVVQAVITDAMECFMVGHELAHLAVARFTDEEARTIEDSPLLRNDQFVRYREEHDCDWLGHVVATHAVAEACGKLPPAVWPTFAQLAGPIFLGSLDVAERASHLLTTGTDLMERVPSLEEGSTAPEDTATHPPTGLRKAYLLHLLRKQAPVEAQATVEQVLRVGEWLDAYLEACWSGMRDGLRRTDGWSPLGE